MAKGKAKTKPGQIGTNAKGHPLFEDERGVRSYSERGVIITEPVEMRPTRDGPRISVDKAALASFWPPRSELICQQMLTPPPSPKCPQMGTD